MMCFYKVCLLFNICMILGEIETESDNENEEDGPPPAELRFVPDDKQTCMYNTVCRAVLLKVA